MAVILLYIHIFPSRSFRFICYGVIVFNFAFLLATILAECLICQPLSYRWDLAIKGASCGDEQALTMYTAGLNLLQDIIVVFIPMPILWGLQMAPLKKLGVACIFGLGIVYGSRSLPNRALLEDENLVLINSLQSQDLRRYQLPRLRYLHHHNSKPRKPSGL